MLQQGCTLRDAPTGVYPQGCSNRGVPSGMLQQGCTLRDAPTGVYPQGCSNRGVHLGMLQQGCTLRDAPTGVYPDMAAHQVLCSVQAHRTSTGDKISVPSSRELTLSPRLMLAWDNCDGLVDHCMTGSGLPWAWQDTFTLFSLSPSGTCSWRTSEKWESVIICAHRKVN